MDGIKVSNAYVRIGAHVQLTEDAKTKKTDDVLTYTELMTEMKNAEYLLVSAIDTRDNTTIYVKIHGDVTDGTYSIYDPKDLESIYGPETPPARTYSKKKFKRTRRNNRKRKTRRSSNRK